MIDGFGRRARAAVLGLAALIATSAAQGQTVAPAPVSAPVTDAPVAATTSASVDYVLGPADKVRITVYGEPALTAEYFVSSSGTVNIPLAGDVQAAGKTLSVFRDNVVKSLQDGYLKDPKVSVEVLTFRPFYILGEVVKPGQYAYTTGLTVFNAVATAGGFTYRANTRKVLIKRANDGGEQAYPLTSQTTIAPGDTIRIPERFF
jgi:polysaccharide export outer membrane protein